MTSSCSYESLALPSHPDARLVLHVDGAGNAIAIGAHADHPGGRARVESAHLRACRAVSAEAAARAHLPGLLGYLGERSERFHGLLDATDATRSARRGRVLDGLAESLATRDAYKAARLIEHQAGIDADVGLVDILRGAVEDTAAGLRTESVRVEAARRLAASSPGPGTLMRRLDAERLGLPIPPAEGVTSLPDADDGRLSVVLGSIVVTPSGNGHYHTARHPLPVELTVRVSLDPDAVEVGPDGGLEGARVDFELVYDPANHDVSEDGHLYGDDAVSKAVDGLMGRLGLGGSPGWSEAGRQSDVSGDMDVDPEIVLGLWPDVVAAATRGPAP